MSIRGGYNITDQYGTYFLTFTTVGWVDVFTRKECKEIIIDSLTYCQKNKGLVVCAYVLMESHLHIIARAEEDTSGLSDIVRDFKKFTSKKLIEFIETSNVESRKDWLKTVMTYHAKYNSNNKKYQLWQQNNMPKVLLHPRFTRQKINYIHNNPVKANIVRMPEHYMHSSAGNYLNLENNVLDVELIDLGNLEGYVFV